MSRSVKLLSSILLLSMILMVLASCAPKRDIAPLTDVTKVDEDKYSCSFDGVEHYFLLYLPEQVEGAPLVLMLHGAGDSPEVLRRNSSFEEDAVPEGYAVAYVSAAPDRDNPTAGKVWNSGIGIATGNDDISFLISLTSYLEKEYKLDSKRTYAVGFSNGAFMVNRLAIEAADIFEAAVSVAGVMPDSVWDQKPDKLHIGFFQITGLSDAVVPKHCDGTAESSVAPAVEDVISYFAEANSLGQAVEEEIGNDSTIIRYEADNKDVSVWHLMVTNGYHSWPSENITGINTNELILEFLGDN